MMKSLLIILEFTFTSAAAFHQSSHPNHARYWGIERGQGALISLTPTATSCVSSPFKVVSSALSSSSSLDSSASASAEETTTTLPTPQSETESSPDFQKKVCLVTGSSRGLGQAIALELAKHGHDVIINYVSDASRDAALHTVEQCRRLSLRTAGISGDAIAVQADTSNPDDIARLFDHVSTHFDGQLDVLINNAGITRDTLVMKMKPKQWQDVIDTNLSGVFYCTQAFFASARKQQKKQKKKNAVGTTTTGTLRIINVSSVVGQIGNPGQANYAAAKGGVLALTKATAKEFSTRGITVNAVCPGFIESDMTQVLDAAYLEKVCEGIPLKRLGKPEEVAGLCRFLALDPAADYITGHTFNVDGGIAIGV